MTGSLLRAIDGSLTPDLVDRVAVAVGESSSTTRNVMSAAVPAVLAGFIRRSRTRSGTQDLLALVTEASAAGAATEATSDTAALLSYGKELGARIFGDKGGRVATLVARATDVPRDACSGIVSAVTAIAAGVVGREVVAGGRGVAGLIELLGAAKKPILEHSSMPPGIVAELGAGNGAGAKPAWPILVGAGLVALVLAGIVYLAQPVPELTMAAPEHPEIQSPVLPQLPKGPSEPFAEPVSRTTITGAELTVPERYDLAVYFASPPGAYPDTFTLRDVSFESGSAELADGSEAALDRLARTLAEHPSARIRVEGHSDALGPPAANEALSRERAAAVKAALVSRGIDAARVEVSGRGESEPVASNADPEGRMRNRRIEIVILSR